MKPRYLSEHSKYFASKATSLRYHVLVNRGSETFGLPVSQSRNVEDKITPLAGLPRGFHII